MTENFEYDAPEKPFAVCEADLSDGELEECVRTLATPRKTYVYLSAISGAALIASFALIREATLISVIALLFSVCLYFALRYKKATAPRAETFREYYSVSEGMSLRVEFAANGHCLRTQRYRGLLRSSFISSAFETESCWTLRFKSLGTLLFLPLPKRGFRSAEEYGAFLKEVIDPLPKMKVRRLADMSGVAAPLFGAGVSGKLYRSEYEGRIPLSVCETEITDAEYEEFYDSIVEGPARRRIVFLAVCSLAMLCVCVSYGIPELIAATAIFAFYSVPRATIRLGTHRKRVSEFIDRSVDLNGRRSVTRFFEDQTEITEDNTSLIMDPNLLESAQEKKLSWLLFYRIGKISVALPVYKSGFRTKEDLESFLSFLSQRLPEQAIKRLKK